MSVMIAARRARWSVPSLPGIPFREWFEEFVRRWKQLGRIEIDLRGLLYL